MSIELIGPAKYDFQYLVSVYLSLPFLKNELNEVVVEQKNGEDLQLEIVTDTFTGTVEVQVKGSEQDAGLELVCLCLAHFPDNVADGCLLERVLSRPDDMALIVASGRGNDAIRSFVVSDDWRGEIHHEPPIKVKGTKGFREEFGKQWEGDTDLDKARQKKCEELAKAVKATTLSAASKRIIVLERITDARLNEVLMRRLTDEFLVPRSQLRVVTTDLYDTVKQARGTGRNIRADLYRVLAQFLTPIAPSKYLPRGEEDSLVQELLQNNLLLLTGPSQCGKTFFSRMIAAMMQKKGCFVRSGADVQEATRFLAEPGPEERLFVLDDPFGHESLQDRAQEDFSVIRSFASSLPASKRLIVTSREDILIQLTAGNSADFGTFRWHNLGSPAREYLAALWDYLSPEDSIKHREIRGWLLEPARERLESGQIARLAAMPDEERAQHDLSDLWLKAKEDARFLSYTLVRRGKDMEDVLAALALTTEPFSAVADEDLAFVLSRSTERPGEIKADFLGIELGGTKDEETDHFPNYSETYHLGQQYQDELRFLVQRNFLVRDRTARTYNFTHPTYRAAAEYTILNAFEIEPIAEIADRALLSLSATSASAASRKLRVIAQLFEQHGSLSQLFSLAMLGLRSIFPATRDNCFTYLSTAFETLTADQKEDFLKKSKYLHTSVDHVMWHNGHAWIKPDLNAWHIFLNREDENAEQCLKELAEASTSLEISPARAYHVVEYLENHPAELNDTVMIRLLGYDESLIRGGGAKIWLKVPRAENALVVDRIFSDKNATVIVYALEGVIAGWGSYDVEERELLLPYLTAALGNPVNAFLSLSTATRIYKQFHGEETPPWDLWVQMVSVLLLSVPGFTVMEEDRFHYCVTRSMKAVNLDLSLPFFAAWIDWIEKQILRRVPSDYMLSVTAVLIDTTAHDPTARQALMSRLLQQRDTSFAAIIIRDCVANWGALTEGEQADVIAVLKEDRIDSRWLKAVALTRGAVPAEVQALLVSSVNFLGLNPREIVQEMPRQLLEDCIAVTTGHPSILEHIGASSGISGKWTDIRNLLLDDPADPLFDVALRELFFKEKADDIQTVYQKSFAMSPDKFFMHLFESGFRINSARFTTTWVYVLNNAPSPEKYEEWITLVVDNIETLDEKAGILSGMVDKKILADLLGRLPYDHLIYMLLFRVLLMDDPPKELCDKTCDYLKTVYREGQPRVLYINSLAEVFAKRRCSSDKELRSLMEKARHSIVDNLKDKSPFDNPVWKEDYELEGWGHQARRK